jgi:LysR family glycine cleavage system transcriptional activator
LSEAFDRMAQAMVDMRPRGETRPAVRLAVPPSFAECWLMPRLASFLGDHPGCDIHVSAGTELVDFARDPVDLAVRFGIGRYPGLSVELLRGEEVFPVCAPALLEDGPPLKSVSDLRFHTLIHDEHQAEREVCPDWGMWLSAAGVHDVPFVSGPRFNQSSMALEAAAQGLGVALAKGLIAEGDLATGRLVRPLGEIQDLRFGYWIVSTPHALSRPEVRLLRDWLHAEVASSPISRPVFSARSANYEI